MFSSGHHPYLLKFILLHSISSVKTLNLNKIIKTNNLAIKIIFIIYHILNYKSSTFKEVKVNMMLRLISVFSAKQTIRECNIIVCERGIKDCVRYGEHHRNRNKGEQEDLNKGSTIAGLYYEPV